MNNQSKKYGFFQSYSEMQKTFERLNLSTTDDRLREHKHQCKLPKIKHTWLITSEENEITQNMDNKEALIYNIPEIILRRKWKSDQPHVFKKEHYVDKSLAVFATYMREIKLSAQIARVSGRYPNTSIPKSPRFKIILPSQRKRIKLQNP